MPNLATVLAGIRADDSLPPARRDDIASALRSFAKAIGQPLEAIPAHPAFLRAQIQRVSPAAVGISAARLRNIRSLLRAALAHAGISHVPGRYRAPLAPAWDGLIRRLPDAMSRFRLSRFSQYCTAEGIAPEAVDDATFDAFERRLDAGDLKDKPRALARTARQYWNKAVNTVPNWPQRHVKVPDYTGSYAVPWPVFATSLRAEIGAWLSRLGSSDPLDALPFDPLRASSIATRRRQIHEYISALVHSGHKPESLRSMADLVAMDRVKDALRFVIARKQAVANAAGSGANPAAAITSVQALHMAQVISAIARHHVKVPIEHQNQLTALCRRLTPQHGGLTARNRARLRQFDDPATVRRMVTLPRRIMAGLRRTGTPTRREALRAQDAVALEILLMVPMRLANLAAIERGRHLLRHRRGGMRLHIPASEVKNRSEINAPLAAETVRLITDYLERYHPVLATPDTPFLFPGKAGGAKGLDMLRAQIKRAARDGCGVDMNPHLARHFSARHYLEKNPGQYGVVRLVLGHKSVNTTTKYYADTDTTNAMRLFAEHVARLRDEADGDGTKPPRGGRQRARKPASRPDGEKE